MVIVVDAYNVLKKEHAGRYIPEEERKKFIEDLKVYAHSKKHTVITVFDGGDYRWPARYKEGLVSIIYSGEQYTADEIIKKLVVSLASESSLLVTSDRALCDYALNYRICSIDPNEFMSYMLDALTGIARANTGDKSVRYDFTKPICYASEKETNDQLDELNELMEKASRVVFVKDKKSSCSESSFSTNHTKRKKQQKKLDRLVRKL